MVTPTLDRSLGGIADAFSARNLKLLVPASLLFGVGLLLSQRVNDAVLPRLGLPADPSTAKDIGAAVVVKFLAAAIVALAGVLMGGPFKYIGGGLAMAGLGLAGADAISLLQSLAGGFGGGSSAAPARRQRQVRRVREPSTSQRSYSPSSEDTGAGRMNTRSSQSGERVSFV